MHFFNPVHLMKLVEIVRHPTSDPSALAGVGWEYKVHMLLGMTIFLLFPFSRLVHVWSGFASIGYLLRPYQVVRSRRLNVPSGRNLPGQSGAAD